MYLDCRSASDGADYKQAVLGHVYYVYYIVLCVDLIYLYVDLFLGQFLDCLIPCFMLLNKLRLTKFGGGAVLTVQDASGPSNLLASRRDKFLGYWSKIDCVNWEAAESSVLRT